MMISPDAATFCLLSFEGPDRYAQAGGLGVRITHLAETLARRGFDTHLLFVGDPAAPGREIRRESQGRLTLHRWCQWISAYHGAGVYDGEEGKLLNFIESAPPFIVEEIVRPALETGRLPVILAEEWHTADAVIRLRDRLCAEGIGGRVAILWNANNTKSFERVDWPRLSHAAQLTTVSRYMKHRMWEVGVNPLVIPNGIPSALLAPVDQQQVRMLRRVLDPDGDAVLLFKVGRFDPDKRWITSIEAAARLKVSGERVVFALRGGIEAHGHEVLARAAALGLTVTDVEGAPETVPEMLSLLQSAPPADVCNMRFFMTQELMRPFYAASDAVLANSGHEPFGLVGLEAMAAGGLVFTGATGEEYATDGHSAVVVDTDSPDEIAGAVLGIRADPSRAGRLRRAARERAAIFTWDQVSNVLLGKVRFVARTMDMRLPLCGVRHSMEGSQLMLDLRPTRPYPVTIPLPGPAVVRRKLKRHG